MCGMKYGQPLSTVKSTYPVGLAAGQKILVLLGEVRILDGVLMNLSPFLKLTSRRYRDIDGKKVVVYKVNIKELDEYINDINRFEDEGGPSR